MNYNYQDAKMESQQEYFGIIHTDNTKTLQNALERIKELEKEKTDLVQEKNNLEYKIENLENKVEHHQEVIDTLQKKLERKSKGE